jgi:hypothetical protein
MFNNPVSIADSDGHSTVCEPDTFVYNGQGRGYTLTAGKCRELIDPPTKESSWQKFKREWQERIDAHRPPQRNISERQRLVEDLNNIIIGAVPVAYSPRFGYKGGAKWRQAVKDLRSAGSHEEGIGGVGQNGAGKEIPTREEATQMIEEGGGEIDRGRFGEPMHEGEEFGHPEGGPATENYPHINYRTPNGVKASVKVTNQ